MKNIKNLIILIVGVVFVIFIYRCPLKFVSGISCPGCGMSRALISLISFDFKEAFYYHPLWPLLIICIVLIIINIIKPNVFSKKSKTIFTIAVCVIFILVYVIRIVLKDEVIRPEFDESLIYRIISLF